MIGKFFSNNFVKGDNNRLVGFVFIGVTHDDDFDYRLAFYALLCHLISGQTAVSRHPKSVIIGQN